MRINYNVSAMLSRNALAGNDNLLSQSLERLSSGFKINHAKDNPAGLAMAKRMNAQIEGLARANDNANDGISVIETAEGSLSEISEMLQRLNELAIKAANGTMSESDRLTVQDEVGQLKEEINRIAATTEFNGQKLLNGEFNLRGYVYGDVDIKVASYSKEVTAKDYFIEKIVLQKEIVAVPVKDEKGNVLYKDGGGKSFYKNAAGDLFEEAGTPAIVTMEMKDTLEKNENGQAVYEDNTGKRFYRDTNGDLLDAADPTNKDKNILAGSYVTAELKKTWTGDYIATVKEPAGKTGFPKGYTAKMTKDNLLTITGSNYFELTLDLSGKNQNGKFAKNDVYTIPLNTGDDPNTPGAKLPLRIDVTGIGAMRLQVGPNEGQVLPVEIPNVSLRNMGIENMDVTTEEGALKGIEDVDGAIRYVSKVRGMLGAYQNRLESTVNSLDITSENMTAAYSRVMDVDMAEEMTAYSSAQVLTQAGTSMLAQANQRPSQVLQLLQ